MMGEAKKRNAAVAGLLTALGGGVGFLYLGRWRWAIALTIALPLVLAISAWTKLIFVPAGLVLTALVLVAIWLLSVIMSIQFARSQPPMPLRKYQRWYVYLGFYVAVSIALNPLIENRGHLLGYDFFRVPSRSMVDTLLPGDYFISNTWEFGNRMPERREVIVFRFPKDPSIKYVQRVIGLPGDTVRIQGSEVRVNGAPLDEAYVNPGNRKGLQIGNGEFKVPQGEFFVLGDNRDNSSDSRFWGTVPASNLYGSVEFLWMSFGAEGLRLERIGKWIR